MIYLKMTENEKTITIDGFSRFKDKTAAIRELGRFVRDHINKAEGQFILDNPEEFPVSESCGGRYLEAHEVPCAASRNENGELQSKPANWFLICRICKF